jgi:hypothetical protein
LSSASEIDWPVAGKFVAVATVCLRQPRITANLPSGQAERACSRLRQSRGEYSFSSQSIRKLSEERGLHYLQINSLAIIQQMVM